MFLKALGSNDLYPDTLWSVCKLAHGEPIVSVYDYDAFVITGSRFNVRDREALPWFAPLCRLIRQVAGLELPAPAAAAAAEAAIPGQDTRSAAAGEEPWSSCAAATSRKIYGACFGQQVVAHALGGSVDVNPHGRGFVLRAERLLIEPELLHRSLAGGGRGRLQEACAALLCLCLCGAETCQDKAACAGAGAGAGAGADAGADAGAGAGDSADSTCTSTGGRGVYIISSHGDSVISLPCDCPCTLLAHSSSCEHEMFLTGYRGSNILCTQGHPEFEHQYAVMERILPAVTHVTKKLTPEQAREVTQSFAGFSRAAGPDQLADLISAFLHS